MTKAIRGYSTKGNGDCWKRSLRKRRRSGKKRTWYSCNKGRIIENLIFKGFVERDKKNLIATHKGISLVTIVEDTFKSAKTTAEWEMKLMDIAQGKASKDEFLREIETEIKKTIEKYRK